MSKNTSTNEISRRAFIEGTGVAVVAATAAPVLAKPGRQGQAGQVARPGRETSPSAPHDDSRHRQRRASARRG